VTKKNVISAFKQSITYSVKNLDGSVKKPQFLLTFPTV